METRIISLPSKQTLEVQLTPAFLDRVASQFDVSLNEVSDDHIRMFIFGAFRSAIDKAENEGFYISNS